MMPGMHDPLDAFDSDGFVLLRGCVPPTLLADLRRGMEPIIARRGTATRHQTVLKPDVVDRSFVEFLNLSEMNDAAQRIVGGPLSFAALAVLLGAASHQLCKWHRDFPDADPEMAELQRRPRVLLQFNVALYDDPSLWVIPGSHDRPTTPGETAYAARFEKLPFVGPFPTDTPDVLRAMPGAAYAPLTAGDCLIYNPVIWHAAEYDPARKRATLHGGWRDARAIDEFRALRWGLEHNPWLMDPTYLGDLGPYFGPQLEQFNDAARRHHPKLAGAMTALADS
jgi:hypothetical protein